MKHLVIGILAHVDAGKTTLSEGILYHTGAIRKTGRVDHGDTFLDTFSLEKQRGITIFSKQAEFQLDEETSVTLLDTPGHVDFSPEMERALQVLDYCVLMVSQQEGVNGHVKTLWKLLGYYGIPTFIFVNKMDQPGADAARSLQNIQRELSDGAIDFSAGIEADEVQENLAGTDEVLMEKYFAGEPVELTEVRELIRERKVFPVYFGSALKMEGVEEILDALRSFMAEKIYPQEFGARVYKITRDTQGERLTWMKITGGSVKVKSLLTYNVPGSEQVDGAGKVRATAGAGNVRDDEGAAVEKTASKSGRATVSTNAGKGGAKNAGEKINQIRIYSGDSYQLLQEATPGMICAMTGLTTTYAGQGIGFESDTESEFLQPVLSCAVLLRPDEDRTNALRVLRMLEEEEPMLHISYDEETKEITAGVMGEVQIEILKEVLLERFGLKVEFGQGKILYKETIANTVEAVGHFEPLRHYAEVHLLMEPGEPGSGMVFDQCCSTDALALNWQRLIRTHLEERTYKGVLTGAEITDIKITVIGGRAHDKHTEGGDFRQATYRAVRQGLMMAENILLEPVYAYRMEIPAENLGRAMSDIERMGGKMDPPFSDGAEAILTGTAPAAVLMSYPQEVTAYTGGKGSISFELKGYEPCHNALEVIEERGYDPEADVRNPSASVFCSHGVGTIIPWDMVRDYMHVDTGWKPGLTLTANGWQAADGTILTGKEEEEKAFAAAVIKQQRLAKEQESMTFGEREQIRYAGETELKEIFERTYRKSEEKTNGKARRYAKKSGSDDALYDESWRKFQKSQNSDGSGGSGRNGTGSGGRSGNGSSGVGSNGRGGNGSKGAGNSGRGGNATNGSGSGRLGNGKNAGSGKKEYLLVDGYNIIFAWDELKALAAENIDSARDALMDIMADFQGNRGYTLILVFDAYKVSGGERRIYKYHNINVVYTKEAETADAYIEKTVHDIGHKHNVTVATSDGLEQMIILGEGAARISARELKNEVENAKKQVREEYLAKQSKRFNNLLDGVDVDLSKELENIRQGK